MRLFMMLKKFKVIFNREQMVLGVFILFCSLLGAIWETLGVSIILPFSEVLLDAENSYNNPKYASVINLCNLNSGTELIVFLAVAVAMVYVVKNLFFILLSWLRAKYSAKIERELSIKVMENYMGRGYAFFTNTNTGTLLRSIQTDVTNANMFLFNAIKLITDLLIVFFIAVYLVIVDWQLAIGVGIMAALCFCIVARGFSRINLKAGKDSREYLAQSNQVLLQALQGAKEVLVLKREPFFVDAYRKKYTKHMQANAVRVICSEIPAYIIEGACVAVIFAIICLRVLNVGMTDALLPILASFVVAAFKILPAVGKVTCEYSGMNYYHAGVEAVYETFLDLDVVPVNESDRDCKEELSFDKTLTIQDVTFAYDDLKVINNMNLEIKKGEAVAFIGSSGSGKTTLSDIILGLFKPQKGQILIDGKDISLYAKEWSRMIGYVSQTMYLADESIRFNVAFGVDDQDIDDERVWECLKKAHVDDYVKGLENGINTIVGERGVKFSGGQRQRIAIARALYHNPQILVLDEATSALDNETENAVMESIEELQGQITLIIVAHRLSTIKKCDRIYEILDGNAVERNKADIEFN